MPRASGFAAVPVFPPPAHARQLNKSICRINGFQPLCSVTRQDAASTCGAAVEAASSRLN